MPEELLHIKSVKYKHGLDGAIKVAPNFTLLAGYITVGLVVKAYQSADLLPEMSKVVDKVIQG